MPGEVRGRNGLTRRARRLASSAAKLAELLVFPSSCRLCGALLDEPGDRGLCPDCWGRLLPEASPVCPRCGRFFEGDAEAHLCGACLRKKPPFSVHRSAARYEGAVKDILLLFKYRRHKPLGKPLARFIHGALGEDDALWRGADGLVPVPLHPRRRRERGFNQAAVLAAELSRLTGIPVWPRALRRTARKPPQTSLKRSERLSNVRGIFEARGKKRVRGRVAILVDDVFTTGATMRECARALHRAGARDVRAVTIARA